jgi:iron complex transport system permease protein
MSGSTDLGVGRVGFRIRFPNLSGIADVPATVAVLALALAAFAAFVWSLSTGDFPISASDVLKSLTGNGTAEADFIVYDLRLPRACLALLAGAALGLSGAITQNIARNPLASPDVLGVTQGAALGAVASIVFLRDVSGAYQTPMALIGAFGAALLVYGLAWRRGVTGYRLVLVGIGLSAVLVAVTSYALVQAPIVMAEVAHIWLAGSLAGRGWEFVVPVAITLAILVPGVYVASRQLRTLQLGDDSAKSVGQRVEWARVLLVAFAVTLAATATVGAGPIAFVALVAPQIGRRLGGERGLALVRSTLTGGLILLFADTLARRVVAPAEIPAGVFTALIGAPFLIWLLARANRQGSTG